MDSEPLEERRLKGFFFSIKSRQDPMRSTLTEYSQKRAAVPTTDTACHIAKPTGRSTSPSACTSSGKPPRDPAGGLYRKGCKLSLQAPMA